MTIEEKQKAIGALEISTPVMVVTQEQHDEYIQILNKIRDWLEQESTTERIEYGTDGNSYVLSMTNGKELEQDPCDTCGYEEGSIYCKEHCPYEANMDQEPCDNCISRQALQTELKNYEVVNVHDENDNLIGYYNADTVDSIVRNLPSVNPQPYEDAISRQAVLDLVNADWKYEGLETHVESLPPVISQPKMGKWIADLQTATESYYICSECGRRIHLLYPDTISNYPYCHCGARMVKLQESAET